MAKVYTDIGFWPAKSGNGNTAFLNPDTITRLERILDLARANKGGKLFFGEIKEEWLRKNGPSFKLDYMPPGKEVAKQEEESL